MKTIVEFISSHITSWGMVWFGLIFWGSIINEITSYNFFNTTASTFNLTPYIFGLSIGLIAKMRGRWV